MSFVKILKIIRIHIILGGALAFLIGVLLAIVEGGSFEILKIILGYSIVLLGDLSTHYSNDYFDLNIDKKVKRKKYFSGNYILVKNPTFRIYAKSISILLFLCSNIIALIFFLFYEVKIEFLLITFVANLLGWFYSAPPVRLVSRGFGEIAVGIAAGFAIPSIGYLSVSGSFSPFFFYFVIPFFIYGFLLSLNLEAPDTDIDRKGGKSNLAVRLGKQKVIFVNLVVSFLAFLVFLTFFTQNMSDPFNYMAIIVISIVPILSGLLGILIVYRKKSMYTFSTLNISSLFLVNLLIIIFLVLNLIS